MKPQLENIVFKYLDNQEFSLFEKDNRLFFISSEGDKYSQIRYDRRGGWCGISDDLINEISSFFSMEESDSIKVTKRWVENTLQDRIINTFIVGLYSTDMLQIPYE